jgi:hypothetical protein
MPVLSTNEAAERLARGVEQAKASTLGEIYSELFPDQASSTPPKACDIARHIRGGLEAEEIVDLWNVVFPEDRNVRYDEETKEIRYNEELAGYPD